MKGGITLSEASANLLRALGDEIAALKEDYVGGRLSVDEFEQRIEAALQALEGRPP